MLRSYCYICLSTASLFFGSLHAQDKLKSVRIPSGKITFNLSRGTVDLAFKNGIKLKNTEAYVELTQQGKQISSEFTMHALHLENFQDSLGKGKKIIFQHENKEGILLKQIFIQYDNKQHILLRLTVNHRDAVMLESRNISPLAIIASSGGEAFFPGEKPKIVDLPFDNDNWLKLLALPWPSAQQTVLEGVSHEIFMVYDALSYKGLVIGSLEHNFWKTGFRYQTAQNNGLLREFVAYGGAARPDNLDLPANFGGQDGTHDVMPHGSMLATTLESPLFYLEAATDFRNASRQYGILQSRLAGSLPWKGNAPMYWNSFGVEGVLGHEGTMMPEGVYQTVDFLQSLTQINGHGKPYLSIDSYDQQIYSTRVLQEIGQYARAKGQEIGFYCCPFSLWTWSSEIEHATLSGTEVPLRDVILRDQQDKPIPFKNGEWGAFPLDPTHPATRLSMISQLEKAQAIGAKLIKIDFLTAGTFEAKKWYNPNVRSGMQAYDYGMRQFKYLVDSIMGPDVFITMAISPMFPHQYGHTRFVSTDVHSHLRDSQAGFPHYGSTAASMITAAHMGWVQGTLWPYTNMDVLVMRKFQKHPELEEQEVKVRLLALMTMGSILGDGSDYRDKLSAERAMKYLNNKQVADYFADPKAFIPLKLSEGEHMDQQLTFFLPGERTLLSAFNFDEQKAFQASFPLDQIKLSAGEYDVVDFMSRERLATLHKNDKILSLTVPIRDALMVELIRKTK